MEFEEIPWKLDVVMALCGSRHFNLRKISKSISARVLNFNMLIRDDV